MPHTSNPRPAAAPPARPPAPAPVTDELASAAGRLLPRLIGWRRDLHRRPELGGREFATTQYLTGQLAALGWRSEPLGLHTGLLAVLDVPGASSAVALRAEIDALPVQEQSGLSYCSEVVGVGHLCGHDAHMAMALGAAVLLVERRSRLRRRVKIVFQPGADNDLGGARAVAESRVMDDVAAIAALHVSPGLPTGTVGVRVGIQTAASDRFSVAIRGKGGHGAAPDQCIDPILAAAHCINALQTVVSRNTEPTETAVLTVAHVHGGTAFNVIPGEARFGGTLRSFGSAVRELLHRRLAEIIRGICDAHGAQAEINIRAVCPPVVNDAEAAGRLTRAAEAVLQDRSRVAEVRPSCTAEDFAHYLARTRGALMFLGTGNPVLDSTHPCHSPQFRIDEDALPFGAAILAGFCLG